MKSRSRDLGPLVKCILRGDVDGVRRQVCNDNRDTVDANGFTPLIHACIEKNAEIVDILLHAGANPDISDSRGMTPLHFCAIGHFLDGAKKLVQSGAMVNVSDVFGNSPLGRAVFESRGRGDMIKLLLRAGADPSQKNLSGVSPLELAKTIANYNILAFFEQT